MGRSRRHDAVLRNHSSIQELLERQAMSPPVTDGVPPHRGRVLPPGIHRATFDEFEQRFGTTPRRRRLLAELRNVMPIMHRHGVDEIDVGGSFARRKLRPGDIDLVARSDPRRSLNALKAATTDSWKRGIHFYDRSKTELFSSTRQGTPAGLVRLRTADAL